MSQFRAAKLDIGCFANIRNIRDHTKRKVFMENEPERYAPNFFTQQDARLMRSQTSTPLHYPKHNAPTASPRAGPASAHADALLHEVHTGQEQVHHGRQGQRYLQRFQIRKSA
jgi:hypothetical protein